MLFRSVTTQKGKLNHAILHSVVSGTDPSTQYYHIPQDQLFKGGNICLTAGGVDEILEKMLTNTKFLGEIAHCYKGITTGRDSVYVLDYNEIESCLAQEDQKYIKKWYKNSDISKYEVAKNTNKRVLYLTKNDTSLLNTQFVKKHLEENKSELIARKDANLIGNFKKGYWWVMATPRIEIDFLAEKIVIPQRSRTNTFGYSNSDFYASGDVYYILQSQPLYSIKFLLGILNSKIIYKWLYYRGKRKGEMLELYQEPLSKIPIPTLDTAHKQELARQIEALVEQILAIKSNPNNPVALQQPLNKGQTQVSTAEIEGEILGEKFSLIKGVPAQRGRVTLLESPLVQGVATELAGVLETQIDQLVYQLYGLAVEEIVVVEM